MSPNNARNVSEILINEGSNLQSSHPRWKLEDKWTQKIFHYFFLIFEYLNPKSPKFLKLKLL